MANKMVMIIDFNNCLFASYYGQKLINSYGVNVNAVKGFFMKLKYLKECFDPDFMIFARDVSRVKTFRRKLYPDYKAQRKPTDPDILTQIKIAQQLVALLGFTIIENETYEADDLIGMTSRLAEANGMDAMIISSDRDMYQLVTDHTFVMSPRNSDLITPEFMIKKYQLTPNQWIDLKILQGDTSDNIPGVRGIGNVTAMSLMHEWGSVDSIYQNLDKIQPSIRAKLIDAKDVIDLTRVLVTIEVDYTKVGLQYEQLYRHDVFENEVMSVLAEHQLYSLFDVMRYGLFPSQYDKMEVHSHDACENY